MCSIYSVYTLFIIIINTNNTLDDHKISVLAAVSFGSDLDPPPALPNSASLENISSLVGSVSSFDRSHDELEICASNLASGKRKQYWNKSPPHFHAYFLCLGQTVKCSWGTNTDTDPLQSQSAAEFK